MTEVEDSVFDAKAEEEHSNLVERLKIPNVSLRKSSHLNRSSSVFPLFFLFITTCLWKLVSWMSTLRALDGQPHRKNGQCYVRDQSFKADTIKTSSTASTTTPLRHAFERRVEDVKPLKSCLSDRALFLGFVDSGAYYGKVGMDIELILAVVDSDINALILDYLTTEGYPSAAAKFSKEANLRPQQEEDSVRARQQIQHSIHLGRIQDAIDALNDLEPQVSDSLPFFSLFAMIRHEFMHHSYSLRVGDEKNYQLQSSVLDSNPSLHFALLRLQLVELIRVCNSTPGGDITPALTFATQQLAPRAPTNPEFLEDLERTMALLVFPPDNLEPQLAALLHPDLRRSVADRVNKAILSCQNQRRDAAIRNLVRLRAWAETTARDAKKDLPARIDLGLNAEEKDGRQENGHESMMD
ncbi:hypothetical protein G7Y89_g360 [Cudoniella acicularis]|uniref:CTLH domain-containing protein n=1 Tax=Cudoniella acicularis TaxID=354080 RepID=A0A8H4RYX2_9HELO|nr:hypothetical protein G7Y89_g360 [Cudoniella acicularis]